MNNKLNKTTLNLFLILIFAVCNVSYAQQKDSLVEETLDTIEKEEVIPSVETGVENAVPLVKEGTVKSKGNKDLVIDVLDIHDVYIPEVLALIEQKSDFIIKVNEDIPGLISLDVQNISMWDALRIILEPHGLAYYERDGVIYVVTKSEYEAEFGYGFSDKIKTEIVKLMHVDQEDWVAKLNSLKSEEGKIFSDGKSNTLILVDNPESLNMMKDFMKNVDVSIETKVFQLAFIEVADIIKSIEEVITDDVGNVKYDEKAKKLEVTDTEEKIEEIAKMIKEIDKKINVEIKAEMFQIRLNEEHQEGVDWEAIVSNYQRLDLMDKKASNTDKPISIGTITDEDYDVLLEALDVVGEVERVMAFSETVIGNQEADIGLSTGEIRKEGKIKKGFKKLVFVSQKFDKNKVDVHMKINPKLKEGGNLQVDILPELQWVLSNVISKNEKKEDIFLSKKQLNVATKNNETIVMGGISQEKEVSRIRKVPLLGNLPFVGFAFRRQNKLFEKTEYVVFVTLRILKEKAQEE